MKLLRGHKCTLCRHAMTSHDIVDDKAVCDDGQIGQFIKLPPSQRVANSFDRDEVEALQFLSARLLAGAFGVQPMRVHRAMQCLANKAGKMALKLESLDAT